MTSSSVELRRRIVRLVKAFPGLHLRELARQTELSEALLNYHVNALVKEGTLMDASEDGYRRFFVRDATTPTPAERDLLAVLRQKVPLQVALLLLDRPHLTHAELTERVGLAKSTMSYHLAKLVKARVLVASPEGKRFALRDPEEVARVLSRWEPPRDLTERFADVWRRFYDRNE